MAHRVTRAEPILLHQALHGYADGHRLLASSISINSRDAKTMLTLSDASGPSSRIDDFGYITGYPLPEAGFYAFAKTWPAPEMPRPGCVWTHTFLIDFSDLATLSSLAMLTSVFRRPQKTTEYFRFYESPLMVRGSGDVGEQPIMPSARRVLRRLAWALYGKPQARVVSSEATLEERAALVLSIWSQQWPRLRRSFRFCTLVYSDRSAVGAPFDLQFVPANDRSMRSRFKELFNADREPSDSRPVWLEGALDDLLTEGRTGFRDFLRALGAELRGGRELFEPLCRLHDVLQNHSDTGNTAAAMHLLEGPLRGAAAPEIRALLVSRIAQRLQTASNAEWAFALNHLQLVPSAFRSSIYERFAGAIWSARPELVAECLWSNDPGRKSVVLRGLSTAKPEEILTVLRTVPRLLSSVVDHRPDLLCLRDVWTTESGLAKSALGLALRSSTSVPWLDAMIDAGNVSLAAPVIQSVGAERVLAQLVTRLDARCGENFSQEEDLWFTSASTPIAIATVLSRGRVEQRSTIAACTRRVHPDELPNDYGEDPCWTAFQRAREKSPSRSRLFLRAWLLARALGHRSKNQADLIAVGFEEVYLAALANRLPADHWQLLDDRLPNSYFWGEWDWAYRLRLGVANAFVRRDLAPTVFGQLMHDDELFEELASETARVISGPGYLRDVKRALREKSPIRFGRRINIIERLL